jgi:hypothetical protein
MCQCKEFLVPPGQQLFSNATKKPLPVGLAKQQSYPAIPAALPAI